jgi:hypothetical protein
MKSSTRVLAAAIVVAVSATAVATRPDAARISAIAERIADSMHAYLYCYPLTLDIAGGLRGDQSCRAQGIAVR